MKKYLAWTLILTLCASLTVGALPALSEERGEKTAEAVSLLEEGFRLWQEEAMKDPERIEEMIPVKTVVPSLNMETGETEDVEMEVYTIRQDGREMRYTVQTIGEPGENGLYPLYITLHGGGGAPEEENNQQWIAMGNYYSESVKSGIYVACRGMEDVWNLHFLDESYAMYDRLIENMIAMGGADPNRVYLLGFSAGGDGVYAVAPRMADRFAAANMSSGHPNGVSLKNTSNLPFEIQVGIRDFYSESALRSVRGAEFEGILNGYESEYGFGYLHRVLVHVPNGHNFVDYRSGDACVLADPSEFAERAEAENLVQRFLDLYVENGGPDSVSSMSYAYDEDFNGALLELVTEELGMEVSIDTDTNVVDYVSQFSRDYAPRHFVWDLSTRAPQRKDRAFYWLREENAQKGLVVAGYDKETNTVTIDVQEEPDGELSVLVNPFLMDLDRPLTVVCGDQERTFDIEADADVVSRSLGETGDPYLAWVYEISLSELNEND